MKEINTTSGDDRQPGVEFKPRADLFRMFMTHTPAAVAMCDIKMRYLAYSRRWAEDYGLGDENLVGRCHYDLFPDLPEHWNDEHQRCFSGEIIKKFVKPYHSSPGDYINITIKDTGVGMDVDTLKMVFDPFFTTKDKERGTGLGLASAYGIVKNHDGIITAQSEKGQGATFNIYLPACA